MKKISIKNILIACIFSFLLVLLDQFAKYLAVTHLKGQASVPLISNVFELQYLENYGAAFGILQGQKAFFLFSTAIFIVLLCLIFLWLPKEKKFFPLHVVTVLYLSGAIGNFIDRLIHDYVIDFFYFSLIDFPIFNVADIYVVVGTAALAFLILFYYKDEDLERIFSKKRRSNK